MKVSELIERLEQLHDHHLEIYVAGTEYTLSVKDVEIINNFKDMKIDGKLYGKARTIACITPFED